MVGIKVQSGGIGGTIIGGRGGSEIGGTGFFGGTGGRGGGGGQIIPLGGVSKGGNQTKSVTPGPPGLAHPPVGSLCVSPDGSIKLIGPLETYPYRFA